MESRFHVKALLVQYQAGVPPGVEGIRTAGRRRRRERGVAIMNLSRRQFLVRSVAVASGAAILESPGLRVYGLLPSAGQATAAAPHMDFPTEPRARLAVASWPFRAYIDAPMNRWARKANLPGMDLKDFAAVVVEKFNVRGIEPLSSHFRSTDPAYLAEFRAAVEKAGSRVVNIPVDLRASFYDPDPARREAAVSDAQHWVDVAVAIGSPSLRTHVARARGARPDAGLAAGSLSQVADYGAAKNVLINLENDDLVSEDAFFLANVIRKANHPWLHALPDFANSMLKGDPKFDYDAMQALFPLAYNIAHMKDSESGAGGKIVTVDVGRTFAIAKAAGYRGYYSMEWDSIGDPYASTQKLIEESLKYL